MNADLLMEEIGRVKENLRTLDAQDGKATAILKALRRLEEELNNEAPRKRGLKRKGKPRKGEIDSDNIVDAERTKTIKWQLPDYEKPVPESPEKGMMKRKVSRLKEKGEATNIMIGDTVKILSRKFDAAYAMGREKFTHGEVKDIKGKIYEVLWRGDSKTTKSHVTNLRRMIKEADSATPANVMMLKDKIEEIEKDIAIEDIRRKIEGWFKTTTSLVCVLPILEVHAQIHDAAAHDEPGNWPKDFLQAMMKEDLREWVSAVKKEIESWHLFDAAKVVAYDDMERGATIIPLGELFTRKRCGKYKFRQIAMGNMLKKGRDYGETFSSTISGDGLRWLFSLAVTCGKVVEYGHATRKMGLKYSGNLGNEKTNVLEGFADSSLSLPRSQGCRCVVMNNAAISFTSKRHTTTDDSTAAAELTEQYLCACDVEGYRNLMQEVGLMQDGPTVIWQDNQAAIQIAMNRGALAKKTRAMDMRVMTIRNKIEDMKVVPMYLRTSEMIADIGTKALDPKLFTYLRDRLCGYWAEEEENIV